MHAITEETIKYTGEEFIYKLERLPESWEKATIIPIVNSGDITVCDNHRRITLSDVAHKILVLLINIRLGAVAELLLAEYQAGYRKGRETNFHNKGNNNIPDIRYHLKYYCYISKSLCFII